MAVEGAIFDDIVRDHGAALGRLAAATEADPERRRDLGQEMLLAVWRALPAFEGRSSLRTFVFQVAHNVAATAVVRGKRDRISRAVPIEELEVEASAHPSAGHDAREELRRIHELLDKVVPIDRQVLLLHLEGMSAAEIGEITGLSAANVATKVSRLRAALRRRLTTEDER